MHSESISSLGSVCDVASCPRATLAFVGRDPELARITELLEEEVLFLIYGVAGVGKTELTYRAFELARAQPGWADAVPTLVQVEPGMTEQRFVTVLRCCIGADIEPASRPARAASPADELESVVRALEDRRHLVFLDDVHLLDGHAVARILGHLARRVRASRIFVASRAELPLAAAGVTPVITRLAPLDELAARRIVADLARRLGVGIANESGIVKRAGGSPSLIQQEMVSSSAHPSWPGTDRLVSTLKELPADAWRLLVLASVIAGRVTVAELAIGGNPTTSSLALLARQFLVEIAEGAIAIHDLVREATLRIAATPEIHRARREAAGVLTRRAIAGGVEGLLAAVEAAHQLCAAGDHEAALAFIAAWHGPISGAGLDHLLLGALAQLRAVLPGEATSIDARVARILIRRGLIEVLADGRVRSAGLELLLANALGSQRDDELPTGFAAELAAVGFRRAPAPEPEIVVDVAQGTITTRCAMVKGRSIACALLACLVDARGDVVPADVLYRAGWGASEYHPLRDRNRLYVAVKRLRITLAELCGEDRGALIETRPGGWRLVAGVVARKGH